MKQFASFVKKEFHHILRDRRTLFILLVMPIAQIIIFGFALTNEVKNSKIVVFDQSHDEYTNGIKQEIDASRYFDIKTELDSYEEIESQFKKGAIKIAIVFPANFRNDLEHFNTAQIQIIADASDPNVANTLTNYAGSIV